jgi:hypothetical protein
MRKNKIAHHELFSTAAEMSQGLIDADLSGHVVKKRVAVGGRGRRSGARTIVATNLGNKWIYIFGFEKTREATLTNQNSKPCNN